MRTAEPALTLTATSPASAITAPSATTLKAGPLKTANSLVIDAVIVGGTGGTLDACLQRRVGVNAWADWVRFPQVAAGVTKRFAVTVTGDGTTIVDCAGGTDSVPTLTVAASTNTNVMPGSAEIRLAMTAGAGTSAGAAQAITITPYTVKS